MPTPTPRDHAGGWQTSAVSIAVTGTDALGSGVDHVEWRLDGGAERTGSPAVIDTDGTLQTLETRVVDKAGNVSDWSSPQTVRIDLTKPVNTTPTPGAAWSNTNYTTTITGSDGAVGSGVSAIEYKINNGAVVDDALGDDQRRGPVHAREPRASTSPATGPTGAPTRSASTRRRRRWPWTAAARPGARRRPSARCPPTAAPPACRR